MCSMCFYIYIYLVLSLVINFENPIVIDVSSGNILINLTYKRWALLLGNATRWGKWVCKVITYRFAHDWTIKHWFFGQLRNFMRLNQQLCRPMWVITYVFGQTTALYTYNVYIWIYIYINTYMSIWNCLYIVLLITLYP